MNWQKIRTLYSLKARNRNVFEQYRKLKLSFKDEFEWNTLGKSRWNFGFHYKSDKLIGDHSFANENTSQQFRKKHYC